MPHDHNLPRMRGLPAALLIGTLFLGSPLRAADDCPPHEPGVLPWMGNGTFKGDLWAWVYLELDKKAEPKRCLMGDNNIHDPDMRFYACRAMQLDWKPATPEEAKSLASTTIKRFFIMPGPDRHKQIREAKKRWFAEHPGERPECYPDD
jgi:hypothetical protein